MKNNVTNIFAFLSERTTRKLLS